MEEELENIIDPNIPPLPKGYTPVKKKEMIPALPPGYEPLKKKESSESTSTIPDIKRVSAVSSGSWDGAEPKRKSEVSSGSWGEIEPKIKTFTGLTQENLKTLKSPQTPLPKINTKLKSALDVNRANLQRKAELEDELSDTKVTPENQEEISKKTDELSALQKQQEGFKKEAGKRATEKQKYSKIGALTDHLATGSSQLGADIAAIPELVYDVFSAPQNAIGDIFNLPGIKTNSEEFKKYTGLNNVVKDYYKEEVSKLRQKSQETDLKYKDGIYDSFVNGDYSGGFDQLTNSFAESLPATTSIMVGGAAVNAPKLIAASSMMFGAGKSEQLKDENPEMNDNVRVANALATGLIQGATESLGTGSIGAAARGLVEREGAKKATSILKDGLTEYYKSALIKNPLLASMSGEGLEEAFQGVAENAVDVATGVKPSDYNVYESMADDFIGGAFGGAIFGAGLKGLKQVTNYQDKNQIKANTKKVFNLQNELQNPNLSPESKKEITKTIDGLVNVNRKLVQKNVNNIENLPSKVREELLKSIDITESTQEKARQIKLDPNTSDETKQILLDNLQKEYKAANDRKTKILEGSVTEVDVLSLKEQDKLKRAALKELTAELNPDGKKNITITNEQITSRANKLYEAQRTEEIKPIVADEKPRATPELDIKVEKGGVFTGDFLNDYDFLAEGSEHIVYRSKDGKSVIKIGEPHNSSETYNQRVNDALEIDKLIGDGTLSVIGTYRSPNGAINPVYQQDFVEGKTATNEQVAEHLENKGFVKIDDNTFVVNDNGVIKEISDISDNFIINDKGKVTAIDASIKEIPLLSLPENVQEQLNKKELLDIKVIDRDLAYETKGNEGIKGSFLENYEYLDDGSEHIVYKSKDGKKVIKLGYRNDWTYAKKVKNALLINKLLGDGSSKVIGSYKSENGDINPVFEQNFIKGKVAKDNEIRKKLKELGYITVKGTHPFGEGDFPSLDLFVIKKDGKFLAIHDISGNFIKTKDGNIIAIDAAIDEIKENHPGLTPEIKNKINEAKFKTNKSENKSETKIQESTDEKKEIEQQVLEIEKRRKEELVANDANWMIPAMIDLTLPENKKILERKNLQDKINAKYDAKIEILNRNKEDKNNGVKTELVNEAQTSEQESVVEEPVSKTIKTKPTKGEIEVTKEPEVTALKNADIAEKRKELGLEVREKVTRKRSDELVDSATKKIKEGYDVDALIDDVLDSKTEKTLTDEDVIILKQYQLAKENRLVELGEEIVSATEDGVSPAKMEKLIQEREELVNDIDRAYRAGEQSGTITARALQARRLAMLQDYSLANMLVQKMKSVGLGRLTPEQIQETTSEYAKIKKLKEQLEAKVLDLEKQNSDLKAGKNIEGLTREERKSKRKVKIEEIDADIDTTIASLRKKLREQAGRLSANAIPIEMIPDIAKLAQLYVKKGVIKLDDIVDGIYTSLKEDIQNLSKDDIKEIIGDYDYNLEAQNEKRLESFKKRTIEKIKELKERLSKQDFEKKQNEPVKLDEEAKKIKDELREAKFAWEKALEEDVLARRTALEKARDVVAEVLSLPRSVMASIDFSAPLRQGLVLTVNNPMIASKAFVEMFRQAVSQNRFDRWLEDLKETPQYEVMKNSGLYIADTHSAKLSAKEEQFMSNLANKIPIIGKGFETTVRGKKVKVGGLDLIGGSERAYVSYLNKLRTDVFAKTADVFEKEGLSLDNSPKLYKALGNYINSATGRGNLGKFEESSAILNSLFFSPRLIASRINLLTNWVNPVWYANTPPKIRQMYALDMVKLIGVGTTLLALASLGGAEVEEDPRSSDFGKIKVGNTRWDIWGGFQQFARFFTQFSTGQRKSTTSKQIKNLDGTGYNSETRADIFGNMIRSKLAPVPGTLWNLASGKTMVGEEYTIKDVPKSFLPLFPYDLYKAIERDGAQKGIIETGIPAVFGVGVQNYSEKGSGGSSKKYNPEKEESESKEETEKDSEK